jgi:hypothetical protein
MPRESQWLGPSAGHAEHSDVPLEASSGVLERGALAPFLYRLGHAQVTGVLELLPNAGAARPARRREVMRPSGSLTPVTALTRSIHSASDAPAMGRSSSTPGTCAWPRR